MKKKRICLPLVLIMIVTLFAGCGANNNAKEDEDTIIVYLWTTAMYEKYAPYIQSKLPDINIELKELIHVLNSVLGK